MQKKAPTNITSVGGMNNVIFYLRFLGFLVLELDQLTNPKKNTI